MVGYPDFDVIVLLALTVVITLAVLLAAVRHYRGRVADLEARLQEATSSRQSLATTYGRITEQFAPFLRDYPFDAKRFRFIGSPVDGVQFEDDRVVFVEFKTNTSRLTPGQERVRRLVEEGRVAWYEFRVDEAAASPPPSAAPPEAWRGAHEASPAPADADAERRPPPRQDQWGAER